MKLLSRLATAAASVAVLGAVLAPSTAQAAPAPLPPVASVDLTRYVGQWNELASIPQIYTLQCRRDTTATYALTDARTVSVKNTCTSLLGLKSTVTGKAIALDSTGASLRVTFDSVPSFGSATTPNYVITALAPDYSWAIVGDPDRRSGFVLSRGKTFTDAQWTTIRRTVEARGYDSCRFITTKTTGGRQDRTPLCKL